MHGLAENTKGNIGKISGLSCIKEFTLIGSAELSLQIAKRLSKDLDLCK
jgi:hypothetical protein